MNKIVPNLWYDSEAEEAANFYVRVFQEAPDAHASRSKVKVTTKYPKSAEGVSGKKAGSVLTVSFDLDGQEFVALNGGPQFKFNEATSLMVLCKDQKEIDYFWNTLIANGGQESMCGWLKDKFGFSWQVVPELFEKVSKDPVKFEQWMTAILTMKKIILADLEMVTSS